MPLGSIELPEQFFYSADYRVRDEDINFADHLAAVRVLPIAIQAHTSLLETLGHDPESSQLGLIMASSAVDYIAEARIEDVLAVQIAVQFVSDKAFDFVFCIVDADTGREVARAKTRMLFYDYLMRHVVAIPDSFVQTIEELQVQCAA